MCWLEGGSVQYLSWISVTLAFCYSYRVMILLFWCCCCKVRGHKCITGMQLDCHSGVAEFCWVQRMQLDPVVGLQNGFWITTISKSSVDTAVVPATVCRPLQKQLNIKCLAMIDCKRPGFLNTKHFNVFYWLVLVYMLESGCHKLYFAAVDSFPLLQQNPKWLSISKH